MITSTSRLRRSNSKKPITTRFFVAVAILLSTSAAYAQDDMTEAELVELALQQPELSPWWVKRIEVARAASTPHRPWRDPVLGAEREQAGSESTTYVTLEQHIPLRGERRFLVDASRRMASAERARTEADRADLVKGARLRFWETLELQRRLEAQRAWVARLEEAAATMEQRVDAGESAEFELERLKREIVEARTTAAKWRAELDSLRAKLARELDLDVVRLERLSGDLLPGDTVPRSAPRTPELDALESEIAAAHFRLRAISRWWVPALDLTGGYLVEMSSPGSSAGQMTHGFVAGVAVSLPLFQRPLVERASETAQIAEAEGRRELLARKIDARVAELNILAIELRQTAANYAADARPRAKRLLEIAEAAYGADELGILEYLDSHRGVIEAELRVIELAAAARRARVELEALLGVEP